MNKRLCPNPRPFTLEDVANWFETEGSVVRAVPRINIAQKDRQPLEKICRALEEKGIKPCQIFPVGKDAFQITLPIVPTAKFIKEMEGRVKTQKACADLDVARKAIFRPRKLMPEGREAQRILTE